MLWTLVKLAKRYHKNYAMAAVAAAFALTAEPAFAIDKIYSPHVVKGEAELEYFGTRTFDDDSDKNNLQAHELSIGYGVTDWWAAEFYGLFDKAAGEPIKMSGLQFENRFQFAEPGEYWIDPGLLVAYTHTVHNEDPNGLEVKLLLEKQWGQFLFRANIGFEQEVGNHAQGGPNRVFLLGSRYRYDAYFEPGFEIQSDFGKPNESPGFDRQEHYIGPAAYGQLAPHLKYEAAYLFGVSRAASKGAARLLLEYEVFF